MNKEVARSGDVTVTRFAGPNNFGEMVQLTNERTGATMSFPADRWAELVREFAEELKYAAGPMMSQLPSTCSRTWRGVNYQGCKDNSMMSHQCGQDVDHTGLHGCRYCGVIYVARRTGEPLL